MPKITDRRVAFSTPWFDVIAKQVDDDPSPHFTVQPADYVAVVATDTEGRYLLVKQFRPVVEADTIELPSGMVDPGETPEITVRRELIEETGHEADEVEFLGELTPDVGRLGNRLWCFAASNVRALVPAPALHDGITLVRYTADEFLASLRSLECNHALNFAVLMLAALKGRFPLSGGPAAWHACVWVPRVRELLRHDRAHQRAVARWEEIRRTLPSTGSSAAGGLTICSVGFRARQCLEWNDALLKTLNPGAAPEWLVFDNNVDPREAFSSTDPRFTVVRPDGRDVDMGYEHALGIAELLPRVRTRFLLVQDPDCFLVRPDWIRDITTHMDAHQLGFFGTPINPRRHNSYRYFPYMVCMFIDLARVPAADLCFIPDVWRLSTAMTYRMRRALASVPKAGALFRWLLTEQWLTNGWRIKAQYGDGRRVKHESVQPVWDVNEAIPAGSLKRLVHAMTPGSVSPIPKLTDYCSPAGFSTLGAPDLEGLGWEEFVWQQRPFAFHVGSVHGKPGKYEAQLERVLGHWNVDTKRIA